MLRIHEPSSILWASLASLPRFSPGPPCCSGSRPRDTSCHGRFVSLTVAVLGSLWRARRNPTRVGGPAMRGLPVGDNLAHAGGEAAWRVQTQDNDVDPPVRRPLSVLPSRIWRLPDQLPRRPRSSAQLCRSPPLTRTWERQTGQRQQLPQRGPPAPFSRQDSPITRLPNKTIHRGSAPAPQ
jgi:hypothetical protein